MKIFFKKKLQEILNVENESKKINRNQMNVFEEMLENFQIEIFSNPKRSGPVSNHQMKEINSLLNRMEYVQKSDLNIGVKIFESDKPELLSYIKQSYELFEENFSEIIYIAF